ncbi:DNA mismatch repair protein [Solitalea longa]|uniref:DNA mismatch repair protein n=1 Tax=Solitalea longa TaxID=2079460 RepID=A0A2S5A6L3_9SPHI|nr:DNA mismatch repair protein [Solitalea longa]POY37937.1 DNA mismatch repair protein [Solitalea longa]
MSFLTDKQSLEDLNLLGKYKSNSIYSLFNKTKTSGGEKLLEALFQTPLSDADQINDRSSVFNYFHQQHLVFPFQRENVEAAESYLNEGEEGNFILSVIGILQKKVGNMVLQSAEYGVLLKGLQSMVDLLQDAATFFGQLKQSGDHPFQDKLDKTKLIFKDQRIINLLTEKRIEELSVLKIARYNYLLRSALCKEMRLLFEVLYELDMYIAVSDVARSRGMGYAKALPATKCLLKASGLKHPVLEKAIANSISLNQQENVLFLTGANMAGKSTWMKTIGASIYLAHLGMPLAADSFEFSVMEGIYSSINVPDNLNMGYSHFYAEVLRVKEVAQKVSERKNLLVLFDELFKGTNVKDAYDATLAVSEAFAAYTNCLFVISTHIIEVGEALKERCENIQFKYQPTVMDGLVPRYTYQLKDGITNDRQGMMIIENERILEIIDGSK